MSYVSYPTDYSEECADQKKMYKHLAITDELMPPKHM